MYRRCRKVQPGNSQFQLVPGTLNSYSNSITADVINNENNHLFALKLEALKDNTFHLLVDEKAPLRPRYRVTDALKGPTTPDTYLFVKFIGLYVISPSRISGSKSQKNRTKRSSS